MMSKHDNFRFLLPLGFVLGLAGVLFAQSASTKNKILVVNGKNAGPAVRQIDGRSYVDIEALAQVTNGVVTIERHRIVLTIPASDSGATASAAPANALPADAGAAPPDTAPVATASADAIAAPARTAPAQPPQGLSRNFASAAIAALAEMREMRGALRTMITYGIAVNDTSAQDDQRRRMTRLPQGQGALTPQDH